MFGSIKTAMVEYFDKCYASIADTVIATTITVVTTTRGGAGRAFQYQDLLMEHILMSRGLQLLGTKEISCTCYILRVERESLAHEFLDLRLRGFYSRPECESRGLRKGVMIMFSWGFTAGSRIVNWWIIMSFYRARMVPFKISSLKE